MDYVAIQYIMRYFNPHFVLLHITPQLGNYVGYGWVHVDGSEPQQSLWYCLTSTLPQQLAVTSVCYFIQSFLYFFENIFALHVLCVDLCTSQSN